MYSILSGEIYSVKKVPGIDHSKSLLKEIVKNFFEVKLAPLSSILMWSSSVICHLVFSECSMLSVYLKYVSRFFPIDKNIKQRIYLKFRIANGIPCAESLKCCRRLTVNRLYQKHVHMSGTRRKKSNYPR